MALSRVLEEVAATPNAVVVFDIDSTLLSTSERHLRILREVASELQNHRMMEIVERVSPADIGWSVHEPLARAGFSDRDALEYLNEAWWKRFFADSYCRVDVPTAGAVSFVNAVADAGGFVVYLTARVRSQQGPGTVDTLMRWGFPTLDGRSMFVLKPCADAGDHGFKQEAIARIARLGPVVATFENEPHHANSFLAAFPDGVHVLLDTCHSPGAPERDPGVHLIEDFVLSAIRGASR